MEIKTKKIKKSGLWTSSILVAFVAAVTIFAVMLQIEKNILTNYEKGEIFLTVKQIPKGQIITSENYAIYLEKREIDKSCIPKTALQSVEQIQDMISSFTMEPGILLTTGMFEMVDEITKNMKEPVIAGCKAEDLYQVVGGVLRAGDRIHIYVVNEEGETKLLWENVFVKEVFDQAGNFIANENTVSSAQRINLYMDKQEVENFYSELALGSLRIVKVCNEK